jgi:hypothetical protein
MPQISSNAEIISGSVHVIVNAAAWDFAIAPQKQNFGVISGRVIKRHGHLMQTEVMPISILDLATGVTNLFDGK